ncbi:hypothetical protein FOZ62_027350 [Perkinsus olseni]|uniref:Uncharacterized protein n=1 Tax=Perkinsus olseni TaxID=32597 RepID=A0A7J6SQT3_PEROL|nr:hypothetical protein FOZ62_027350 [Perkinsus olseni]
MITSSHAREFDLVVIACLEGVAGPFQLKAIEGESVHAARVSRATPGKGRGRHTIGPSSSVDEHHHHHSSSPERVSIHDPRPRSSSILVELAQHGVLPQPESSQAVNGAVPRTVSSSGSSDDGDGDNARTSRSSVASPPSSSTFEDAVASATATTSIHTAISSPSTWKDRPEVAAPPQRKLSSYRQQREELHLHRQQQQSHR